ncbi:MULTISPECIES: YceI family protein [unclassified Streptomyces]|uniref:YceI family protein n=1 Tax=unclassified Streptomyces TaxID=2593676 RepID=UPI0029BF3184|nr:MULTISPECIES: YceI family protein [unclassified Streptomyces]MDX3767678.1 YceI family protein [Streptomyces sp. AK08-01B]MDX3820560.1 YceI family protein [Streptomyces sp. AK08-01A]
MSMAVETGTWQLDPTRSTVGVRHKTMWGMVTVKGAFTGLTGGGEVGPDGSASGSITLDATSLDTKNAKRDTHLRSADFFDADRHPELTFAVHSATPADDRTVQVAGELTARGISRPQSFTAHLTEASADAVALTAEFTVDREQFGMGWNQLGMIRGATTVTASLHFVRATS